MIAAPSSGSGKTTVSRGLMAAFRRRGLRVAPFKCGPDYIDTKFHAAVCGVPSVNLDSFMSSPKHIVNLYAHYTSNADISVVEGMMGLFDGYERDRGSASEIARIVGLPIILVVDARSTAYSVAALLSGFINFRSDIDIVGVIFNRVGSERHKSMLRDVCIDLHLRCFGFIAKDEALERQSRYLGLDFSQDENLEAIDYLADTMERSVDIDALLNELVSPLSNGDDPFARHPEVGINIAVLQDSDSFSFIYAEHLDILRRMGSVTILNPEKSEAIPENTDLLYLPGGYPERHADRLSASKGFIQSVHDYIERGGRALAECGGMIYLSKSILLDGDPSEIHLCGVLPFSIMARRECRRLHLGYRRFSYNGLPLKGHEFHYTRIDDDGIIPASVAKVFNALGEELATPVFRHKNLIASYTHLYWGEIDILRLFD